MASAPASTLRQGARRFPELVALAERRLGDAFGGRVARLYGWGIALSYGFALALLQVRPEAMLAQALVAFAWIPAGLVALGAAKNGAHHDDESAFVAFVQQRGFDTRDLELARLLATALRIVRVTGYPALVLVLVRAAIARDTNAAVASAHAALGAACYVFCLAVLFALLARAAALLTGGRGRLWFVALVLAPHAARAVFPGLPSVPALLGAILDLFFAGSSA
jgi:hypothetical protein